MLFNNKTNFLKNVVKHYLRIFIIKHRNTILYYLKKNERIENLNKNLNNRVIVEKGNEKRISFLLKGVEKKALPFPPCGKGN